MLWEPQTGKGFPCIWTLSPKPLSQMATYWFVIAWFDNQSIQKSEVRQAAKDVVKSEVLLSIGSECS